MTYLPKARKFNGEVYRLHDDYLKSSMADWQASKLRSKGWNARVVKAFGLYGVYKRRRCGNK